MKLTRIHAEGFGKLRAFDLSLNDGITCVTQPNGWGKSTICAFLKGIFYGLCDKKNLKDFNARELEKYTPWQGGPFGGYVEFESRGHHFRLERNFAEKKQKATLADLTANKIWSDADTVFPPSVGEYFFSVSPDGFEKTVYLSATPSEKGNEELSAALCRMLSPAPDAAENDPEALLEKKIKEYRRGGKGGLLDSLEDKKYRLENQITSLKQEITGYSDVSEKLLELEQLLFQETQKAALPVSEAVATDAQAICAQLTSRYGTPDQLRESIRRKQTLPKKMTLGLVLLALITFGLTACAVLGIIPFPFVFSPFVIFLCVPVFRKLKKKTQEDVRRMQQDLLQFEYASNAFRQKQKPTAVSPVSGERIEAIRRQISDLTLSKYRKEEAEDNLRSAVEELDALLPQLRQAKERFQLLGKALEVVRQAKENLSCAYLGEMKNSIARTMRLYGQNDPVLLNQDLDLTVLSSGGGRVPDAFSSAYRDFYAFAVRLALTESLWKKKPEKPFLLLDDPFIHCDEDNFEKSDQLLRSLSSTYQILYFTCHNTRKITD